MDYFASCEQRACGVASTQAASSIRILTFRVPKKSVEKSTIQFSLLIHKALCGNDLLPISLPCLFGMALVESGMARRVQL